MQRLQRRTKSRRANAFTLVEIMVAIVIIAILMGLLLPAISGIRQTARVQEVKSDIEKLNTAITQFKQRFGTDLPGSIVLCEKGSDWNTPGEQSRSRGIIRQIWPQYDFSVDVRINNDGDTTDIINLDGAECLVFFLGGMIDPVTGALVGFSKNPAAPFALGGNREGPFFEFKGGRDSNGNFSGRLTDISEATGSGDGMPEYLDPIPGQLNPYVYFSNSYRTGTPAPPSQFSWVNWDNWMAGAQRIPRAYYQAPIDPTASGALKSIPHNRSGYQIISPGFDYHYGEGGPFDASDDSKNGNMKTEDRDNITNFHPGMLSQ